MRGKKHINLGRVRQYSSHILNFWSFLLSCCLQILDVLHSHLNQTGTVAPAKYVELTGSPAAVVASTLQALTFIFRLFVTHNCTVDEGDSVLSKESDLSPEKRQLLLAVWKDHLASNKVKDVGRTLSLGKLVNFSWRVGVGIAASNCAQLATPFVTLSFEISSPSSFTSSNTNANTHTATQPADALTNNGTQIHVVECTYREFQEVRKKFQDIFAHLDAI